MSARLVPAAEPDYAAFVAIDWADREHAWALEVAGSSQRETGRLEHTPEAIEAWAIELARRFAGRLVAVALEQARGALLYALSKYPHLVLYPIHPSTSYDFRKAVYPSGSKDDPRDADILLDLLTLHRSRLRRLEPDTDQTRQLQMLVENRRHLVDERTAQTNRITAQLKLYFPQVLKWFDALSAPIAAAFLRRWPRLADVQKESPETLCVFFHQHGSRSENRIRMRIEQIRSAQAPIDDAAIIEPAVLMVQTLIEVVAALNQGIQQIEHAIEAVAAAHPDYLIFASFPAAGPVMAPRLLAAFGSQRDRFENAGEVQSYSGIAPVKEASGRQQWVHFRWSCPKFLRQTFHEYAALSIQHCTWAKAFYDQKKKDGKEHHAAVRSLAYKWIRILFRCWRNHTPYQEDIFLAARALKSAPTQPRPVGCGNRQNSQMKSIGAILKNLIAEA
jgi:transposase